MKTKIVFLTLAVIKKFVVKIQYDEEKLYSIAYTPSDDENYLNWQKQGFESSHMSTAIKQQFASYFKNPHFVWSLPFDLADASRFRQRVWQQIQAIKPGDTATYGKIAKALNSSPRAVANACRSNPLAIIIPCHRVVAKNNLGGYDGEAYSENGEKVLIKKYLLEYEGPGK